MTLRLSSRLTEAIRAHACAAAPCECCGLLLGDMETGVVTEIRPAINVAADPAHCFEIDPLVLLAAHKAARSGGPAILGHYHSHPGGDPVPSAADAAAAEARGETWLIVGADGSMRAWRASFSGALLGRFDARAIAGAPEERPCAADAAPALERP